MFPTCRLDTSVFCRARATTMCGKSHGGFSLIELAVVLVVVALVLGGLLIPVATQVEQQRIKETQKVMEEIKEALIGYSVSNNHLPCPDKIAGGATGPNDTPNDGVEDFYTSGPSDGHCFTREGNVPWVTLGTSNGDAWGRRFRYRVTEVFSDRAPALNVFTLSSSGDIAIRTRGDDPATPAPASEAKFVLTVASNVPAIIISHGRNGLGGTSVYGISQMLAPNSPPDQADENENQNGDAVFISRAPMSASTGCSDADEARPSCEFDDLVTWLSPNILFNRMVAAGRLP